MLLEFVLFFLVVVAVRVFSFMMDFSEGEAALQHAFTRSKSCNNAKSNPNNSSVVCGTRLTVDNTTVGTWFLPHK